MDLTRKQEANVTPQTRTQGFWVETVNTLNLCHQALWYGRVSKDTELVEAADTVLSALTLGLRDSRQRLPFELRPFIQFINERLKDYV